MSEKYVGNIEDFYNKQIKLLEVHTEGVKFEYDGKIYDTKNNQSVYEIEVKYKCQQ